MIQRQFGFARSSGFSQLSLAIQASMPTEVGTTKESFTAQPEAPASIIAGASGWAVNRRPQDATKSKVG